MNFKIHPLSIYEQGHYREGQEDNIFPAHGTATAADRLFMVCDGMGGHDAGEVASQAVCEAMSQSILAQTKGGKPVTDDVVNQALTAAFDLLDQRDPNPDSIKKMGTTMTLVAFHDEGVTVAHIGDSRIYQFRPSADGKTQVMFKSEDHSLVNDLIKVGELTPEEAKTFPQKNVITRAMQANMERRSKADIRHLTDVCAGDYFYLCSDGMLENATDENLCFMIGKPDASDDEKVQMLRGQSDDNRDNHSAYLIHVLEVEGGVPTVQVIHDSEPLAPVRKAEVTVAPTPVKTQSPSNRTYGSKYEKGDEKGGKNFASNKLLIILAVLAAIALCLFFMKKPKATDSEPDKRDIPAVEHKQQPTHDVEATPIDEHHEPSKPEPQKKEAEPEKPGKPNDDKVDALRNTATSAAGSQTGQGQPADTPSASDDASVESEGDAVEQTTSASQEHADAVSDDEQRNNALKSLKDKNDGADNPH